MRFAPLVGFLACCSLAMLATSDASAAPAGGGRYVGDVLLRQTDSGGRTQPACRRCLSLIVANDGLSLEDGYLGLEVPCSDAEYTVQEWPPATTQIDTAGAFSWSMRDKYEDFALSGQFTADGSQVEGHLSWVGGIDGRCGARDVAFRAMLTGRPARTRPRRATACGSVPGRNSGVVARERGTGCTRAKALALAWAHDPTCAKNPSASPCRINGFECAGAHGGRFSPQATVRCVTVAPPKGAVEFVMEADCGYVPSARLNVTALNTPCRNARRTGKRMPQGCGLDVGKRCRSGRYRCRVTENSADSSLGFCVRRDDSFFAVSFEYVWPL